ncbi:MAG: DUF6452 family protein [Flavobacterium sp.]
MKKISSLYLVVILSIFFSGCEKDDICDATTSTTPRLIIEFYDNDDQTDLKNVINLQATGEGAVGTPLTFIAKSKIELPLKAADITTKYSLVLTAADLTTSTDILEFNYSHEDIFISRACGFKTVFALNGTSPFVLNGNPLLTAGNWIKDIEVIQPNINDENETHIKIYF